MIAEDLIVTLERGGKGPRKPCHRQIYEQIRSSILMTRLQPGDRLPATRDLASRLGIARNTVARAYDDLVAEGYLESQVGSGTRVSAELPREALSAGAEAGPKSAGDRAPAGLASWASRALSQKGGSGSAESEDAPALPYDFRPGIPDWGSFPRTVWLRILGGALRDEGSELTRYGDPAGYFPLRHAIARHLAVSRGVTARPEQVVIVSGAQQALDLLIRLRVDPGDSVVMEDPGYPDARQAFLASGADVAYVPVDEEGLVVDDLARRDAKLAYVTPSHQFPTGATLSLARRLALLDWAGQRDTLIVEDDYDSEFRYAGRRVESLQGLDRAGRVAYVGTFSTVLFPPFRVGYVVLPETLVAPFVHAKKLADRQNSTLEQIALARFIEEGHFERHLRRMRRLATDRRSALGEALWEHARIPIAAPATGMHLLLPLGSRPSGHASRDARTIEATVAGRAAAVGVGIYPVGSCYASSHAEPAFVLGYAALTVEQIREGARRLAEVILAEE